VTDGDMFVASSALNLLALNMRLPQYFGMSGSQKKVLTDYVIAMGKLTRTHLSVSSFLDPRGIKKNGLNFDVGNWDNDPQFQFASDTVMKFPGACWVEGKLKGEKAERDPLPKAKGVGWDISHARRFVHYFETLLNLQSLVGQKFLTKDDLKGLTDQAFLGTLRIRSKKPYFTNFMSGHMGWFRVCYEDRPNFGLAPLCTEDTPVKPGELKPFGCLDAPAFAESAYGFWLPYSPNYSSIMKGIWARYESVNPKVIKNIKALPSFYYAIDGK
jgi:hypothetical protein